MNIPDRSQSVASQHWKPWENTLEHGEYAEIHHPDLVAVDQLLKCGELDLALASLNRYLAQVDGCKEILETLEQRRSETNYSPATDTLIQSKSSPKKKQRRSGDDAAGQMSFDFG